MAVKKRATRSIQDAIDEGARTAEEIHKSIAELPLKILEESDALRSSAREVRRVQARAIGRVYDLVRKINHAVGSAASDMLAEASAARRAPMAKARKRMRTARAHAH